MKFLEITTFALMNTFLAGVPSKGSDSIIDGRIECYSCKRAGSDKKLYKNLDQQYQVELSKSPEKELMGTSPFGPLSESSSRKTFIELIAILNASFPDYDFSRVKVEQFMKEKSVYMALNSIDSILSGVIPDYNTLAHKLWSSIDDEIKLKECDIYSYIPDLDSDPFSEEGSVWSFGYFFKNRKLKRVVFFTCNAVSKNVSIHERPFSHSVLDDMDENDRSEDDVWTNDMDL